MKDILVIARLSETGANTTVDGLRHTITYPITCKEFPVVP